MYVVVEFPNEKVDRPVAEVVPQKWLVSDRRCRWPRKNYLSKAKQCATPSDDWDTHEVKVVNRSEAETFSDARKILEKLLEMSDVQSTDDGGRRAIRRPFRYDSSSSDDEEDRDADDQPASGPAGAASSQGLSVSTVGRLPTPPRGFGEKSPRASAQSCEVRPASGGSSKKRQKKAKQHGNEDSCMACSGNVKVVQMLGQVLEQQAQILGMLQSGSSGRGDHQTITINDMLPSPLETSEGLKEFDQRLLDKDEKEKLVTALARVGGLSVKDFIRRALERLLSNGLMSLYSLVGRKGKLPFKNLTLHKVLLEAGSRLFPQDNESRTEERIALHLRDAPQRMGGTKQRENRPAPARPALAAHEGRSTEDA